MSTPHPITDDEMIELRGGVRMPVVALRLAWQLEELGVSIHVGNDGSVALVPGHLVPADDIPALRRHKADLAVIARYTAEPPR